MLDNAQKFLFLKPPILQYADISLVLEETIAADPVNFRVPIYRFAIVNSAGDRVGHISFKVGDSVHIREYAGHIGYAVDKKARGSGYAAKACLAIRSFVNLYYDEVIITADPANHASIKTILKIGATFMDERKIPSHIAGLPFMGYAIKKRFRWKLHH